MLRLSTLLLIVLAAGACETPRPTPVANTPGATEAGPRQTIYVGTNAIVPDATTITPNTTIDFRNQTFNALQIRFESPKNMKSMVTGAHVDRRGQAPWLVFYWDNEERLVATLDPGKVGTLCCLAPGKYSFTVKQSYDTGPMGSGTLANEGTITVK